MAERTVSIEDIRVEDRHRSDLGDLDSLAASIASVGLIHAIVVTDDLRLVAGQRRLEACRLLEWDTIPVRTIAGLDSAVERLVAERDENTCRKNMTATELYALGRHLEELERPKARERQREAGERHGRGMDSSRSEEQDLSTHDTREVVGEGLGFSGPTWQRLKYVGDRAAEGNPLAAAILDGIDSGEESITGGYNKLRERDKAEPSIPAEAPSENGQRNRPLTERVEQIEDLALQGYRAAQIADELDVGEEYVRRLARKHDITLTDFVLGNTRAIDSNRIVSETVGALEGLALGVELVEMAQLDPNQVEEWATSLSKSLTPIKKLARQLKEMARV